MRKSFTIIILAVAVLAVMIAAELLFLNPDTAGHTGLQDSDGGSADSSGSGQELPQSYCKEGLYPIREFVCLEKEDRETCYVQIKTFKCCLSRDSCVLDMLCFAPGEVLGGEYDDVAICIEGKLDFCTYRDVCEERDGYYCNDKEMWVEEKPEICEGRVPIKPPESEPREKCPEGGFYRGEWDCFDEEDDEMCGSVEAAGGCCPDAGDCWLNEMCYGTGQALSESSEWVCVEGDWDKCRGEDDCTVQGELWCYQGVWQEGKPENCE